MPAEPVKGKAAPPPPAAAIDADTSGIPFIAKEPLMSTLPVIGKVLLGATIADPFFISKDTGLPAAPNCTGPDSNPIIPPENVLAPLV